MPNHKQLLSLLSNQDASLSKIYASMARDLAAVLKKYKVNNSSKLWFKNKTVKKAVDNVLSKHRPIILNHIYGQSSKAWELSNTHNDVMVNDYIKGITLPNDGIFFQRNTEALQAFLKRSQNGLNLSDRVWNLSKQTKGQLEYFIASGLTEGRSATSLAKDLQRYLKHPTRRFRRLRDKTTGRLKLSDPAKNFKPGRGVYRSSYKNALRLARNEVNIAYRTADFERRKKLPFVLGVTVNLSPAHPKYDICFTAWQYKITTSKGQKYIKDIEAGDLVLTHKGRFRKVSKLFKSTCYDVDKTEIQYEVPYDNRSKTKNISATSNHPFLINGEWKRIDSAKTGNVIKILATRCKSCDTKIPMYREYCSKSCSSRNTATNQWKNPEHVKSVSEKRMKVIKDNGGRIPYLEDWVNSGENVKNITSKSAIAKRTKSLKAISDRKMKNGTHPFIQPENIRKSAQALGNSHNRSFIEKKMQWLLSELKISNETQKIVFRNKAKKPNGQRRYFKPDFVLSDYKIIIECDGDFWHSKTVKKDLERQRELESMGYMVLRFKGSQIRNDLKSVSDEIQRVVYNHEEKYEFLEYPISKVRHYKQKQTTPITKWNFQVEEDNSYIVNGVVVHNCDELVGDYPKEFKFVGWHANCLCFTTTKLASKQDFIKQLKGKSIADNKFISAIPNRANKYLQENADKIKGLSSKPYFIRDNFKNTKDGFALKKSTLKTK
ncbi:DUF559 domain-containing protein [Changchengzhania lutea]|uniref:DUF559 domain-containing protein n=1 Tax=Changchengzhania lutea TaxID=2049305 RepID=UPI00115C88C6|nr:DUF559 domain-containing protein [Changchengzhania lutea]